MRLRDCIHYNGIQHDVCDAGVKYDDRPEPRTRPCLTLHEARFGHLPEPRALCPKYESVTQAHLDARQKALDEAMDRLRRGVSGCCEAPLEDPTPEAKMGWFRCSKCRRGCLRYHR